HVKRGVAQTQRKLDNFHVRIDAHFIHHGKCMNVARCETTLFAMKVPPEMSRHRIDGSSPQIKVTGSTSGSLELCQKRHDIPNGIQHMATNDDVSRKIIGSILPGS